MKLIVQRVGKAIVTRATDKKVLGEIGKGLLVLVGIKKGDTEKQVGYLVEKLSGLRVMADKEGKMNLTVSDAGGGFLVVSQFTLYADTTGGNRPSFINAEESNKAKELYELFVMRLKENGIDIQTGSFGDYMQIEAVLDGPVTIIYSD